MRDARPYVAAWIVDCPYCITPPQELTGPEVQEEHTTTICIHCGKEFELNWEEDL